MNTVARLVGRLGKLSLTSPVKTQPDLSRSCSQHGYRQAVGTTTKTNLISKSMHHTRGTLTLGQNNAIFPQSLNVNLAVNSSRAIHSNAGIIIPHMDKMTKASTNTLLSQMNSWKLAQEQRRGMANLYQMHLSGPHHKKRPPRKPLDGAPMLKGVVLKTLVKKPKKPNSANRKCVLVRLSNGKEKVAYVPGIGHNLQEHNIVMVRVGRLRDTPGVKLKCIRGKYDLPHVQKAKQ